MSAQGNEKGDSFVSSLGEGRAAFLSEVSEYSLQSGERSPEDFLAHFSSEQIMNALKDRPKLRATILTGATGTHEKIAPRMSAEAAGETLQIALDEEIATPQQIVELFESDDRQRYLDDKALWAFTFEGEPWSKSRQGAERERARRLFGYLLGRALHHKLIDQKELITALSVARLTTLLPPQILAAIIEASLDSSNKFSHADLVEVAPPEKLAEYVPLDYVWEKVVLPLIVERHGYAGGGGEPIAEKKAEAVPQGGAAAEAAEVSVSAEEAAEGKLDDEEFKEAIEAAGDVVEAEELADDDEEDVMLDDDDDDVQTVTEEDDDVFDDLLEEGLSEPEASSGPGVKRTAGEEAKKNASAH